MLVLWLWNCSSNLLHWKIQPCFCSKISKHSLTVRVLQIYTRCNSGWGLINYFSPIRYYPCFWEIVNTCFLLNFKLIFDGCLNGGTWKIWMWFKCSIVYVFQSHISNKRQIGERNMVNHIPSTALYLLQSPPHILIVHIPQLALYDELWCISCQDITLIRAGKSI